MRVKNHSINFCRYKQKFGFPITLEHDTRFHAVSDLLALESKCTRAYRPKCVYGNVLTEELDAIYKFEDLDAAVEEIAYRLSLPVPQLQHAMAAKHGVDPALRVDRRSVERINKLYGLDFHGYGYAMTT